MSNSSTSVEADRILLVDLKAQYRAHQGEIDAAMRGVVENADFTLGQAVDEFEAAFATYCGVAHGIGVASGTDALLLALKALGVGVGDEVIVPTLTFAATAEPLLYLGARPVFVDVLADDLQIDPVAVEAAITPATRGILPVHLHGFPADLTRLDSIARRHGLWLLEDAAQAHGATWDGRRIGSFGTAACFSFYPSKNLGAYGDGGMVVTGDAQLAEKLRVLRNHGQSVRYEHGSLGYCSRLDTLQAAVLLAKLPHLDSWNQARATAAARYDELIGDELECIGQARRAGAVHHVYAVRIPNGRRDAVLQHLTAEGIGAGIHYPIPLHRQPVFVNAGFGGQSLPVAEQAATEILSLPLYPEITSDQQARVVRALMAAL